MHKIPISLALLLVSIMTANTLEASEHKTEIHVSKIAKQDTGILPLVEMQDFTETSSQHWTISQGSLKNQLKTYAENHGWNLVWQADFDLEMKVESHFSGDFLDFIEKLFLNLQTTKAGLRINIYKANSVLEVRGE